MNSSKSLPKPTEKGSSDSGALSYDLYSNLTYMASLAVGRPSRNAIFEHVIRQKFQTAIFFQEVYLLTQRLGFEYVHAFKLVADTTRADTVKSLLLRFGSAISSGESEADFLLQEAKVEREKYEGQYLRRIDSLQKWSDGYAAFLVSATLIMVVALISTMLFEAGTTFMFVLGAMMAPLCGFGVWVIYASVPQELMTYQIYKGPAYRQRAIFCLKWIGLPGLALATLIWFVSSPGVALLVVAVAFMPTGIFAHLDDARVRKIDKDAPSFIRALGNVTASLGSTVTAAIHNLDLRSMQVLEPYLYRLQTRLDHELSPAVSWESFRDEAGSELLNRASRMYVDGTALGGNPEQVGEIASNYALTIAQLRAKRRATAQTFSYLVLPLHGAMTALLVFISSITMTFNSKLQEALADISLEGGALPIQLPALPIFQERDLSGATTLIAAVVLILTIANSLAPRFASGGHILKIFTYLPVMAFISGINLIFIPPLAESLMQI